MSHVGCSDPPPTHERSGMWLFLEGYRAERINEEMVVMRAPNGHTVRLNPLLGTCTCGECGCMHVGAWKELLAEQCACDEAQIESFEAQYDAWGMTLENDQIERGLREIGVCEF